MSNDNRELRRRLRISVLSPHRGDACSALGLSLVRWARGGHQIQLINCFTRSLDAPYSDVENVHANDRMSYVSALLAKEDKTFLRQITGAEMIDLRLKDAPIRLRCVKDEVYGRAVDRTDPAVLKIAAALGKRLVPEKVDIVLLPLGLDRHVDHSTVTEAALPLAEGLACGFYEEMPAGARDETHAEAERTRGEMELHTGQTLSLMLCRAEASAKKTKHKLANIYCSQGDPLSVDQTAEAAEKNGGERIWANGKLLALADAVGFD